MVTNLQKQEGSCDGMECKDNKDIETRKEVVVEQGTCDDQSEALTMKEKKKKKAKVGTQVHMENDRENS